jgi:hypothetical protein
MICSCKQSIKHSIFMAEQSSENIKSLSGVVASASWQHARVISHYNDIISIGQKLMCLCISECNISLPAWISSTGIWSKPADIPFQLSSSNLNLRGARPWHKWLCCLYFCLPNTSTPAGHSIVDRSNSSTHSQFYEDPPVNHSSHLLLS